MSNFLSSLPLYAFGFVLFIVFIMFIRSGFNLLRASSHEKVEEGRRSVLTALYALFSLLIIILVFLSMTYLLRKGEALKPKQVEGEFPASPVGIFPPPPDFIDIKDYYFSGPYKLTQESTVVRSSIYALLCKTADDNYDIIGLESNGEKATNLSQADQIECWAKNCGENLYYAVLETPKNQYEINEKKRILDFLIKETNPVCFIEEE